MIRAPDIYVYDLKTENLTQLTFNPQADDAPVWSRDGSRIFYRAYKDGVGAVAAVSADGGAPELLARSESGDHPMVWSVSPDGARCCSSMPPRCKMSISDARYREGQVVKPLLDLTSSSRSLRYRRTVSGCSTYEYRDAAVDAEVDIRPFPDARQQRRPVGPGVHPVFSPDGSEIFVFDGAGLSVAPVQYSPFRVGSLRKLFRGQYWYGVAGPNGPLGRAWDVDPKNDRFLMITMPAADSTGTPVQPEINVVVNWLEELRAARAETLRRDRRPV